MAEFRKYCKNNCKKGGLQKNNLSKSQEEGLKSLSKRIKEGEILVLPTDKSGKLCVMTRNTYELSGNEHIGGDDVVSCKELWEDQKTINGHVAMLQKVFKIQVDITKEVHTNLLDNRSPCHTTPSSLL